MPAPPADRDSLAEELKAGRPRFDERQQRLAVTLYRLLAEGEPVPPERLAGRAATTTDEVTRLLDEQPGVYLDDQGRVIGFWGMALTATSHRVRADGRTAFAWCALDALFLPELIGRTATVESRCPTTGEEIALSVGPDGIRSLSPAGAVLSFLHLDGPFDADTITSFCHFVHFFASQEAAREWTARHDGTFVISIEDGFEIGRQITRATFGSGLDAIQHQEGSVT